MPKGPLSLSCKALHPPFSSSSSSISIFPPSFSSSSSSSSWRHGASPPQHNSTQEEDWAQMSADSPLSSNMQVIPHRNMLDKLRRNKINLLHKYCWFILTNPIQRKGNLSAHLSAKLIGGLLLCLLLEGASSQVMIVVMIDYLLMILMILAMIKTWFLPVQLLCLATTTYVQADPTQPFGNVSLHVVTLHKIKNPDVYVLKREPAPAPCKRSSLSATSTAWSSTSMYPGGNLCDTIGSERFELLEETSRWLFNCDHHFYDNDGNGEISLKMIVTTKEAFELKYKSDKTMFAQVAVCAPRTPPRSSSSPRCPSCGLQCSRSLLN